MDDTKQTLPEALDKQGRDDVQSRMVSLLAGQSGVKTLDLPKPIIESTSAVSAPARPF